MSHYLKIQVFCQDYRKPLSVEGNKFGKVGVCYNCDKRKILIDKIEV